jgi:murein DD-endopeptidase MepM/ murein hydrolase activator NlpD
MRLRLCILAVTMSFALWLGVPNQGGAQSLSSKIDSKRSEIDQQRSKERVLVSDIQGVSNRIGSLEGDIGALQAKQDTIQSELDTRLTRLVAIQSDLRTERAQLLRLRARLAAGREQLSLRLVELYKADSPDLLTVVLHSNGFADLLENSEFARRVGRQDNRIISQVASDKAESERLAAHLTDLEDEQKQVTEEVEQRRDDVALVKQELVGRRNDYAAARQDKRDALSSIKGHREHLEGDLRKLQAQEARISGTLSNPGSGGIVGQVRQGSGGLIWPVSGPIVSPFGMRWGRLHAGVDIAVASGTPVAAAAPGTVAIAGWVEGYGNYVCIQHSGSLSTCYGHNTSLNVSVGQHVSQGQIISSSGCTGHCFGPHVHFETRINGTPVDPMGYL